MMRIELLKHIYFRLPVLIRLLVTIILFMSVFGILIHFIEPEQFPTVFDGVWWAFVTAATVGYGDYVPLSYAGRITGIILMLSGAGLLTFYISNFAAATVKHERDLSKGKISYKGKGHTIFVGWNERTKSVMELVLRTDPKMEIVLIDKTLEGISYQNYAIHFIHGDAADDAILRKANLQEAERVVITSDMSKNERQADNYTILSTVAIRGNNKNIPIIVEIQKKEQVQNAKRAGASTIIRPNDFLAILLYHELFRKNQALPFESLLKLLTNQQFQQVVIPAEFVNKTFLEAIIAYKKRHFLLVGVIRENEWHINPSYHFPLRKNDQLILLSHWQ